MYISTDAIYRYCGQSPIVRKTDDGKKSYRPWRFNTLNLLLFTGLIELGKVKSWLFWDVTHRRLVVSCWRFGTTYLPRLQGCYRNVSNQLIVYAAQHPKDAKVSFTPRRKLEVRPQKFSKYTERYWDYEGTTMSSIKWSSVRFKPYCNESKLFYPMRYDYNVVSNQEIFSKPARFICA
jgi:hypothetical protein